MSSVIMMTRNLPKLLMLENKIIIWLQSLPTSSWITSISKQDMSSVFSVTLWSAMISSKPMLGTTSASSSKPSTNSTLKQAKSGSAKGTWMTFGLAIVSICSLILKCVMRKAFRSFWVAVLNQTALKFAPVTQLLLSTSKLMTMKVAIEVPMVN